MVIAANCQSVQLRRERMGGSNGRVYTIYLMVDDGSGNVGTATYKVKVRHSQAQAAVENAIAYTVNSSCSLLKSVPAEPPAVAGYSLMPNVPNPFSTSTTIEFVLSQPGHVTLTVHDVNSNLVATLVDADQSAGDHSVLFDASEIRSGMYICRLQINGTSISRRMFLIR
jgi:hypothetical protein